MFKRVLGISGIAILTLAIAVGVNMWRASGDVIGGADNSTSTVKVVEVSTYPTQLGECYSKLPSIQGLSTVIATSCTDVHHWQIVSIGTLALDTFDAAKTQEGANQICTKAVNAIVKAFSKKQVTEYQNASYTGLAPSATSWDRGGRTVDCLLGSPTQTYIGSVLK